MLYNLKLCKKKLVERRNCLSTWTACQPVHVTQMVLPVQQGVQRLHLAASLSGALSGGLAVLVAGGRGNDGAVDVVERLKRTAARHGFL